MELVRVRVIRISDIYLFGVVEICALLCGRTFVNKAWGGEGGRPATGNPISGHTAVDGSFDLAYFLLTNFVSHFFLNGSPRESPLCGVAPLSPEAFPVFLFGLA